MEKFTEVFYWGSDTCGQFGVGDRSIGKSYTSPKCCSFCILIKQISCGDEHSGFIAANGYVYMMGSNKQGKLGINNESLTYASRPLIVESLADYQIIDLSCGGSHTAAVTASGVVFTWGNGAYGALGINESENSILPKKVSLNNSICKVSCGGRHTAVITEDAQLVLWGANEAGQLGIGNRVNQKYPAVNSLNNVLQVACGVSHTLVLARNAEVFATGGNSFGQLGLGNKESSANFLKVQGLAGKNVVKVAAGQHSAGITSTGELFVWGSGIFGELLVPCKMNCASKFNDLDVGNGFGMAIDRSGNIWGWGSNSSGALGTGDQESKAQPFPVIDLQGRAAVQVACGSGFVIALGKDMEVSKSQVVHNKSKSNDLLPVLEEMKKEIQRLQKGAGGLEEMSYKLEQSKIKQNHLQSLLHEETRQKEHLEDILKDLIREKEKVKREYQDVVLENEQMKDFIEALQTEVERKDFEIQKVRKRVEDVENDQYLTQTERDNGLGRFEEKVQELMQELDGKSQEIQELHQKLQRKTTELDDLKYNSVGIANHNSVLSQEIKEIPIHLNKISSLEKKLEDLQEKNNEYQKEIDSKDQETLKLQSKIQELIDENESLIQELSAKDEESSEIIKLRQDLITEKEKTEDLTEQVRSFEEKIQDLENSNFLKLENYSKEVSLLTEKLNLHSQEVEYFKEIHAEQEKVIKKLKQDLRSTQEELEAAQINNQKIEDELSSQSEKNKEILSELTKQVASRADAYKTLSKSFNPRRTKRNALEDDIDLIYAKP
jgi:X-linked retinitis pigmentosa GTPase regulator